MPRGASTLPSKTWASRLSRISRPGQGIPRPIGRPPPRPPSPASGEGKRAQRAGGAAEPPPLPLPDKPSIAVLPFANMSGDREQEYFADGMVEEIITAQPHSLALRHRPQFELHVQGPSRRREAGQPRIGVRYVLEGSVRKAGGRVRITAQLIEAETGADLWADRFDGSLEDVFDLQDKVASSAAGVIEPTLQAAEIRRTAERSTDDLTAYDLYLRALPHWASHERERLIQCPFLLPKQKANTRSPILYGSCRVRERICRNRAT
jgi:adenylate cyclase